VEGRGYAGPTYLGQQRLRIAEVRQAHVASMRTYAQRLAAKGIQLVLVVDNPSLAGDFQGRCHSLAATQATRINGSARIGSGSSGGLLIHTSSG
jgi:hypothetical protein